MTIKVGINGLGRCVARAIVEEGYDDIQLDATAQKYFKGQSGLVLLTIDTDRLDAAALKFEPARDGALFPHLYGPLPVDAVIEMQHFQA